MSRPDTRQSQMLENAEHLHTLAVMESVLDEELDRLECEHEWGCRKYVYLQALGSDSVHLRHMAMHIQKSRGIIDMLRSLLEDTFEEKLVFMNEVRNLQLQWRMEDSQLHHNSVARHHHQHLDKLSPKTRKFHSQNSSRFLVKRSKKFIMSARKAGSQRSHSYLTSLTSQSQMSINVSEKCRKSVNISNRSKQEIRKTRNLLPKKSHNNKKNSVSQKQHSKTSPINKSQCFDTRQEFQLTHREQNNALSNITNEMSQYRQVISNSPVVPLPLITNQPIGLEDFRHAIRRHVWRCDRSSDLFCFGIDSEDETMQFGRED